MSDNRLSRATTTGMNDLDQTTETATKFIRTVDASEQDTPGYSYSNSKYSTWYGYYKSVPELQAVVHRKAIWTLGKGYEADGKTKERLDRIRGCGKDSFNSIMFNCVVVKTVGGDSFCEIIKNKRGELRNLKPLDARYMTVKSNSKGIITGYEQFAYVNGVKTVQERFKPDEIFHLMNNRTGMECHGHSTIEKLEDIINAKNESMKDMRIIFHRYVKPLIIVHADTDDSSELAALTTKLNTAVQNMENMVVPKDTVEMERMSIPQFSTLDPLPWLKLLQQMFILSEGVPEVILGLGADTTEASAKILYLAFQQVIEHEQRYLEEQLKLQCNLDVEFNFPAALDDHMEGDMRKEGGVELEGKRPGSKAGRDTGKAKTKSG